MSIDEAPPRDLIKSMM